MTIAGGTPGIVLMERAGAAVADEAARMARARGRIAILCGPGGNGGDGFIAARLLAERGYRVELCLLGERARAARRSGAGGRALARARSRRRGIRSRRRRPRDRRALRRRPVARHRRARARACVERDQRLRASGGRCSAVDVPSGVDGETGAVRGVAGRARARASRSSASSPAICCCPGASMCGRLALADIGIAAAALDAIAPQAFVNAPPVWRDALAAARAPTRTNIRAARRWCFPAPAHRTGAARLAARAALRVGRRTRRAREPARRGRDQCRRTRPR